MTSGGSTDRFRVLCVCTGNVYRSRIAEHELRAGLSARLGAKADHFEVSSAGTGAVQGRPVGASESAALQRCGLPADDRPSRRLTAAELAAVDLVLCADRSNRAAVLDLAPAALRRTFLLREFARVAAPAVDLAVAAGVEPPVYTDPVPSARQVVIAAATFRGYVPRRGDDEIADPWGKADSVLSTTADLVRGAVPAVVEALTAGAAAAASTQPRSTG